MRSAISRCTSTAQRTASTTLGEFDEQPVAGGFDDAAAVLLDLRVDQLAANAPSAAASVPSSSAAHQPRIAGDIGRHDRRQPPLYAI